MEFCWWVMAQLTIGSSKTHGEKMDTTGSAEEGIFVELIPWCQLLQLFIPQLQQQVSKLDLS